MHERCHSGHHRHACLVPPARKVGYEMCRDMYVFWHIELCAHDTGLVWVMRGHSLKASFDWSQDSRNKKRCAQRMRIQYGSKSKSHADKWYLIFGILGWPNKTRSDAARVLLAAHGRARGDSLGNRRRRWRSARRAPWLGGAPPERQPLWLGGALLRRAP